MNTFSEDDGDLLRRLAAADADSPPPPGPELDAARLDELLARRRTRRLAAAAAGVACVALVVSLAVASRPRSRTWTEDGAGSIEAELRALRADLESLRASLPQWPAADPADDVRFELARARANAVAALTTSLPETRR